MSEFTPRLWSDFDGTAVRKFGTSDPRNWTKYPLPGIPDYLEFIKGVQSAGVEFAGVVTKRKRVVRQLVTNMSLNQLGYSDIIKPNMVEYAGTEERKGYFIALKSTEGAVGMIDDKPHKLGIAILEALALPLRATRDPSINPILLGVVPQFDKSQEYIEKLAEQAVTVPIDGLQVIETGSNGIAGLAIRAENLVLDVIQLAPYSQIEGKDFSLRLLQLARST
jgi:hypothetical protein